MKPRPKVLVEGSFKKDEEFWKKNPLGRSGFRHPGRIALAGVAAAGIFSGLGLLIADNVGSGHPKRPEPAPAHAAKTPASPPAPHLKPFEFSAGRELIHCSIDPDYRVKPGDYIYKIVVEHLAAHSPVLSEVYEETIRLNQSLGHVGQDPNFIEPSTKLSNELDLLVDCTA